MDVNALFTALCTPVRMAPLGAGPVLGLFLAGLGGSVMHCAPMCGPFVLGQISSRMARLPARGLCERHRRGAALLLPYHCGRLATYAVLGAMAGGIGAGLGSLPWVVPISAGLLLTAAALFGAQAMRRLFPALARVLPELPSLPTGGLARRAARHARGNGLALGLLLGFLPCGLLYAALATAAAAQSALGGAVMLLAFGIGTIPALVGVGLLGQGLWRGISDGIAGRLSPAVLALNALLLGLIAVQRLVA